MQQHGVACIIRARSLLYSKQQGGSSQSTNPTHDIALLHGHDFVSSGQYGKSWWTVEVLKC